MNFADEPYVRVFVRDTATWISMRWEARALLMFIMRKLDRSGCIDLSDDIERSVDLLAQLVNMPRHAVRDGLFDLLRTGTIVTRGVTFVMPKFTEAQSFTKTDAERAREYRSRKRSEKLGESDSSERTLTALRTLNDAASVTNVTNVTLPVTNPRSVLPVLPSSLPDDDSSVTPSQDSPAVGAQDVRANGSHHREKISEPNPDEPIVIPEGVAGVLRSTKPMTPKEAAAYAASRKR